VRGPEWENAWGKSERDDRTTPKTFATNGKLSIKPSFLGLTAENFLLTKNTVVAKNTVQKATISFCDKRERFK
jgi:hypothetical protein